MEHKKEMSVNNKPSAEKQLTQAYVKLFYNWHVKKKKKSSTNKDHPDTSALIWYYDWEPWMFAKV